MLLLLFNAASVGAVGTLSSTTADDTVSSASALAIAATLAVTTADDTLSATTAEQPANIEIGAIDWVASVVSDNLSGDLAQTEAADTLTSAAALAIGGTLAVTPAGDTVEAGVLLPLTGIVDYANLGDTLSSANLGQVRSSGQRRNKYHSVFDGPSVAELLAPPQVAPVAPTPTPTITMPQRRPPKLPPRYASLGRR